MQLTTVAQRTVLRGFDLVLAIVGLILSCPIVATCCIAVIATSRGPAIFAQARVGRRRRLFTCFKLRTMRQGTRSAASHEVSAAAVTRVGSFLRRTKLDELPQLWNVLTGEMSLVGPRPCLPSQTVLIEERDRRGVYILRPGITGPAQVLGVDMSQPERLAALDETWLTTASARSYFACIIATILGGGRGDRVLVGRIK